MFKDLRYSIRTLLRRPAFTVVAVVTLALGIGANTAIFSVVNTVLLRTLPFQKPEQLVSVGKSASSEGLPVSRRTNISRGVRRTETSSQ
jgi:putative ABC transport system permease protein